MTNQEMQMVLSYIVEKMDSQSQDEVKEILGGELPSLGEDALMKGGFARDRCPKRLRDRAARSVGRTTDLASDAKPAERDTAYPNWGRLK